MARKKRKKKKEPFEFKVPEFDEVGFMKRELEGAKAAMLTIVYAFVVALASYSLTLINLAWVGGLAGLAAVYGLRYLYPLAGLDMSKFDWKLWAGNGAVHLFAWFAFWVLLLNPPFLDISPPVIHNATTLPQGAAPPLVGAGGAISLTLGGNTSFQVIVNVSDNQGLAAVTIQIGVGSAEPQTVNMVPPGPGAGARWTHTVDPAMGGTTYSFVVQATDRADLRAGPFAFTVVTS